MLGDDTDSRGASTEDIAALEDDADLLDTMDVFSVCVVVDSTDDEVLASCGDATDDVFGDEDATGEGADGETIGTEKSLTEVTADESTPSNHWLLTPNVSAKKLSISVLGTVLPLTY